ncbi:hypothetical protein, partial [Mesorhizobium japonicum]|uniref:hypothetical protein n=1 Tax=Mesorhizobium japonicum TaxID=2066070 RepID=UPI003B5C1B22
MADTMGQAMVQGLHSLKSVLSLYVKQRRRIPLASEIIDPALTLQLPMMVVAKIMLWNAMRE